MTSEEAKNILAGYVKACQEDDFIRLEEFSYEDVMEAMRMGADALALTIPLKKPFRNTKEQVLKVLDEVAGGWADDHPFSGPESSFKAGVKWILDTK